MGLPRLFRDHKRRGLFTKKLKKDFTVDLMPHVRLGKKERKQKKKKKRTIAIDKKNIVTY